MKKVILIPLLMFAISGFTQIGIGAGVIVNKVINPAFDEFRPRVSFMMGSYYNFNLSEYTALRLGVMYLRKGMYKYIPFTDINGNPMGEYKNTFRVNYLELPVTLVIGEDFHGLIGLAPSYSVSSRTVFNDSSYKSNIKHFDIGIHVGLGGKINVSEKNNINVDGILSYGLLDKGWGNNLSFYLLIGIQRSKKQTTE